MNIKEISASAIFGAIVTMISLTISHLLPYPIIPYLKFDLAEIIEVLSLLLFGPAVAFSIAILHFFGLIISESIFPAFVPLIGPFMKFLAVSSTLIGLYIGLNYFKFPFIYRLFFALFLSLVIRNIVMTIANYIVLNTLYAPFISGIADTISKLTGIYMEPITLILIFTALYNTLHVFIAFIPAYLIALLPFMPNLIRPITEHWLLNIKKKNKL